MAFYDGASCPVCHRAFEDGDDIVCCPDCGTPHHRECYSLAGHCANEGLHKSGYSFYEEKKKEEGIPAPPIVKEAADGETPNFAFPVIPFVDDSTEIDGNKLSDIRAAVRSNTERFVSAFRKLEKGRKASWNWSAFFFGSLYFFYRKMYKQGIMIMSLIAALIFGSNYALAVYAPKFTETMIKLAESASNSTELLSALGNVQNIPDMETANMISYITFGALLIIRIVFAIFADSMYKTKIAQLIKSVDEFLNDSNELPPFVFERNAGAELNSPQLRLLYLSRKGGVSPFAPCIALLVMEMVLRLIAQIQ